MKAHSLAYGAQKSLLYPAGSSLSQFHGIETKREQSQISTGGRESTKSSVYWNCVLYS